MAAAAKAETRERDEYSQLHYLPMRCHPGGVLLVRGRFWIREIIDPLWGNCVCKFESEIYLILILAYNFLKTQKSAKKNFKFCPKIFTTKPHCALHWPDAFNASVSPLTCPRSHPTNLLAPSSSGGAKWKVMFRPFVAALNKLGTFPKLRTSACEHFSAFVLP